MPPRHTILIVDDEKNTREGLLWSLEGEEYDVLTAATGEEGLETIRSRDVHLLITDLKMPGMDGMELMAGAREESPTTTVVILTGHGTVEGAQPAKGKVGGAMKFAGRRTRRIRSALQHHWTQDLPLHVRAMVLADKTLFIAGPPDLVDEEKAFDGFSDAAVQAKLAEQGAAFRGQKGALLLAVSAADGKKLAELKLDVPPAWDGMVAARGRLYLSTTDGKVLCLGAAK